MSKLIKNIVVISVIFSLNIFNAVGAPSKSRIDIFLDSIKNAPKEKLVHFYSILSNEYCNTAINEALKYAEKAVQLANDNEKPDDLMDSYNALGMANYYAANLDKSLDAYKKALEYAQRINNKKVTADILNYIGVIYKKQGKYQDAVHYYQQSLSIYEALKDTYKLGYLSANIGNIYYSMELDYDKALDYYKKSLEFFEKINKPLYAAYTDNSIGLVYFKKPKRENDKALEYYQKAHKIFIKLKTEQGTAMTQSNMADVYLDEGKFDLSEKYFTDALAFYKKIGDQAMIAQTIANIGKINSKKGNYSLALKYLKEGAEMERQKNMKKEMLDNYKEIASVYKILGDFKSAYENYQTYSMYKDSVLNDGYLNQIQEMSTKYETDKKEKEIQLQKADLTKKDLEAKRKNLVIYAFALIILIVVVFSFLLYKQFNEKKKANVLLAKQNDEITMQRDQIFQQKKEITDSIHYASRIQRAVLSSAQIIANHGLEHFILFKPRDIVSGDFYWMNEKDGRLLIAAADCTGHGVPGAFMSMLGMAFLNEIASKEQFDSAAQVLNQLRAQIVTSLHQTGKEGESKDGMDISFCIIEKDNSKMQFAGAFNSSYIIRKGELIEANADRMPIGFHDRLGESFTNHEIDLMKGDTIYILSDGYIDQFGGENGKKFMAKRFKSLLLDVQNQSMSEQKEYFDKTITEWRGNLDQVDDVMVIGLRV